MSLSTRLSHRLYHSNPAQAKHDMKTLALAAGLTLAAAVAQADTLRLNQGHVVCRNLDQAIAVMDNVTVQAGTDLAMRMIQTGECIMLPKGEAVLVRYREGRFSCVSPVTGGQCGWTMLMHRRR
jgi:hypothetical protein